mmetsp:Transcript_4816/g.12905  ORF Transcript_4816/g.12905 Transcript_4816/m.12905 type:complete len:260 (-) Transcript_4816:774-1553(-)
MFLRSTEASSRLDAVMRTYLTSSTSVGPTSEYESSWSRLCRDDIKGECSERTSSTYTTISPLESSVQNASAQRSMRHAPTNPSALATNATRKNMRSGLAPALLGCARAPAMMNENTVVPDPDAPIDSPKAALPLTGLNMCRARTADDVDTSAKVPKRTAIHASTMPSLSLETREDLAMSYKIARAMVCTSKATIVTFLAPDHSQPRPTAHRSTRYPPPKRPRSTTAFIAANCAAMQLASQVSALLTDNEARVAAGNAAM